MDEGAQERPGGARRALWVLLTVLVLAAQAVVLLGTGVMGLGWGGPTYLAALAQAALAVGVVVVLAVRRHPAVVLVPVVSAALTAGLVVAGGALGRAEACSGEVLAAARAVAPPPGETVRFQGEELEGCVARARMGLPAEEILAHYEAELARLGWQEDPGRHEARLGTAAVKDGVHVVVDIGSTEDAGGQVLELVVGGPDATEPCLVNRVGADASLPRDRVTEVGPGQWVVFVSSDDLPASVTVRDGSGSVVLEHEAHRPPAGVDDLMELDEATGGSPSLTLDEGGYEIECRTGDGASTVAPLRVAHGASGGEEQVVVTVFETPEHWQ